MKNKLNDCETTREFCHRKGYEMKDDIFYIDGHPKYVLLTPKPHEASGICFGHSTPFIKNLLEQGIMVIIDDPARIPSWHTKEIISKLMKKGFLSKRMKSFGNMKAVYTPVRDYIPQLEFIKK